jgi:hypothetical protein
MPVSEPSNQSHFGDLRKRAFLKRWLAYRSRRGNPTAKGPKSSVIENNWE